MKRRTFSILLTHLVSFALAYGAGGCDSRAEQESADLQREVTRLRTESESLAQDKAALEAEVASLRQENQRLAAEHSELELQLPQHGQAERRTQLAVPALLETERHGQGPHTEPPQTAPAEQLNQRAAPARQRLEELSALLFERGDWGMALALAQTAFDLGAQNPEVIYRIAWCKAAVGQYEAAAEWYERVLGVLQADTGKNEDLLKKCLNNYGVTQQRIGKPDRAAELYRQAVALDGAYAPPHFNLGLVYANDLNRRADAVDAFRKHVIYGGSRSVTAREMIERLLPPAEPAKPSAPSLQPLR